GGALVGPIIGGVLTQAVSWRWAFLVNLPIGVAAIVVLLFVFREERRLLDERIDWPGAAALTIASGGLLLALNGLAPTLGGAAAHRARRHAVLGGGQRALRHVRRRHRAPVRGARGGDPRTRHGPDDLPDRRLGAERRRTSAARRRHERRRLRPQHGCVDRRRGARRRPLQLHGRSRDRGAGATRSVAPRGARSVGGGRAGDDARYGRAQRLSLDGRGLGRGRAARAPPPHGALGCARRGDDQPVTITACGRTRSSGRCT